MSDKDAYAILMKGMGFPGSARLRHIMEELMTPEQARMAAALPGTPEEVAKKTQIALDRVKDGLDDLFFKGAVAPRGDFRKREYFRFALSIVQLHNTTMATQQLNVVRDHRFFELWYDFAMNEMYPASAKERKKASANSMRTIPSYYAIKDIPGVLPYENIHELLKAQSLIAVAPGSCRYCTAAVGKPCKVHDEVANWACWVFGRAAEYVIARGSGKKLSLEEALELNDKLEKDGLWHKWPNTMQMTGLNGGYCNCCRDCCEVVVPLDQAGLPITLCQEKSRFGSYVNLDACTGCQVCMDRCPFDAITMERPEGSKKFKAAIDPEKCFGCGICVVGCEPGAIKMRVVRPPEHIPAVRPATSGI